MARKYTFTRGRYKIDRATGEFKRVTKSGEFYKVRSATGHARTVLENRPGAKTSAQLKIGRLLKAGKFSEIPNVGVVGTKLKRSVLSMADAVGVDRKTRYKIERMNRDKLAALMAADSLLPSIVFDYGGYDYEEGAFISEEGIANIEFLISRYEKVFGVLK